MAAATRHSTAPSCNLNTASKTPTASIEYVHEREKCEIKK